LWNIPGCPQLAIHQTLINDFCPESLHVLAPGRTCIWCGQKMYKVMTAMDIRGARKKEIFHGFLKIQMTHTFAIPDR
jgi:hypothetical protein